jgi:MoaA/NifB/PqqE/SkfB family radical SAM enzyme
MTRAALQIFSVALLILGAVGARGADLQRGQTYAFSLRDVDGNDLSTADGHVTIITVVTRQNEEGAHAVADLVPDRCVGDPKYRYITLVNFQRKLAGPLQGLTRAIIRNRLDAEAKALKPQYDAKKITRDPRRDVYVVADFDGAAVARVGLTPETNSVAVFVFNGGGALVNRWTGVPQGNALPDAIAAAEK